MYFYNIEMENGLQSPKALYDFKACIHTCASHISLQKCKTQVLTK